MSPIADFPRSHEVMPADVVLPRVTCRLGELASIPSPWDPHPLIVKTWALLQQYLGVAFRLVHISCTGTLWIHGAQVVSLPGWSLERLPSLAGRQHLA